MSKGIMFDPVIISHDIMVQELIGQRNDTLRNKASSAFIASLTSKRLEMRSALGSYSYASNLPAHSLLDCPQTKKTSGVIQCDVCGHYTDINSPTIDLNVLNFERFKWGGVRHDQLEYAWFNLFLFQQAEPIEPKHEDYDVLRNILDVASHQPSEATPSTLSRALLGVFKSNDAERRVLIEILGLCGILQPLNRSGYFSEFTLPSEREHTGQHSNDWGYPIIWWRGSDGVNEDAVQTYFPGL